MRMHLSGLCIKRTNQDGKSAPDMAKLWADFLEIQGKIPHKIGDEIYVVYYGYKNGANPPITLL